MKHLSCKFVGIALMLMLAATAQASTTTGFTNGGAITISSTGNATPYPSRINVTGINNFTRIEVTLNNLSHTYPDDIDILLVAPDGRRTILISDAGGEFDLTNQTLTFTPSAAALPDTTQISTGSYRPINFVDGPLETDTFSAPGPGILSNALAEFGELTGASANGFWDLYVVDDATGDSGSIAGGWTITFTVPAVFTVTKIDDTNDGVCNADCSLREALALAQNGDLINFSSLFDAPQTINLLTALPAINRSITIQGKGANLTTVRRPSNAATSFRIFEFDITGAGNGVVISGMTISGGDVGTNFGGGILSQSPLTLSNVHVTGNTASNGGGVYLAFADGVFTNCTFSNNSSTSASGSGGGFRFQGDGGRTLRVMNSTISGNRAANAGGGLQNSSNDGTISRLEITNSTIANNTAGSAGGIRTLTQNTAGSTATTTLRNTIVANNAPDNLLALANGSVGTPTFQTLGFNLSDNFGGVFTPIASDITSATPRLAPLALYGGQTPTHALRHASPAINAGDASGASTDQRGAVRVFGTQADIGAVEMRPRVVTNTSDIGAGSLRDVLALANADVQLNDIQFDHTVFGTSPQSITLGGNQLSITTNANVIGPGANLLLISGNNASRVFQINGTATLSGLSIAGGNGNGNQDGGGISNLGTLTLTHATLRSNTSILGGGGMISAPTARLTVTQCAIFDNQAGSSGGGLAILGNSAISSSTISGNTANNGGGISYVAGTSSVTSSTIANNTRSGASGASGVAIIGGTTTLRNTLVAANTNPASVPDVDGAGLSSAGFNLIGNRGTVTAFSQSSDQSGNNATPLNPLLNLQLRNEGGTTATHAFLAGSPALDKGDRSGAVTDQRGLARPVDLASITNTSDASDIGAFEAQTVPTDVAPTAVATAFGVTISGATEYQFVVDYTDDSAIMVSTLSTGDVNVSGPAGFTVTPTFAFVNINSNGTPRAAVYVFTPPGGSWDTTDNGTYTISMRANEVSDATGNFVAAGTLTTFSVNIPGPAAPTLTYNPSASTTINFPAGPAGTATSSIAVTSTGGTAPGSVQVNNCSAPSGFAITNAPINFTGIAGGTQINGSIALSCTRGASALSGTLSCSETPNPGTTITRSWTLNCPAATALSGTTLYALTQSNSLLSFDRATPGTVTTLPITGLVANELVVAIDTRVATGELYGLGLVDNGLIRSARLYRLNPMSGAASLVGSGPWTTSFPDSPFVGLNFDPITDVIRITSRENPNFRVHPVTAAIVATDTPLSVTGINGVSFTNNDLSTPARTLYGLDFANDQLVTIGGINGNPSPNGGLVSMIGGTGITANDSYGFEITSVAGLATAYATTNGRLYQLNLSTGAATDLGAIGAGGLNFFGLSAALCAPVSSLAPANNSVGAAGGGFSIGITAGSCGAWRAQSNDPWLTISGASTGSGNGALSYSVAANTGAARTGSITISGHVFTVNQAAGASGFTVSNTNDSGPGSLRQALADAAANGAGVDTITFSNAVFSTPQVITLTSTLSASSSVIIQGPGAQLLSVSGNNAVRVLIISNAASVSASGITLTQGLGSAGGAIFVSSGSLTLSDSQVINNRAEDGAGILSDGSLTLVRVLIANNSTNFAGAPLAGGGVSSGGTLSMVNSTISGNSAQSTGQTAGGVLIYGGTATITSSTISNNAATSGSTRAGGILFGNGSTLISVRSSIVAANQNNASVADVAGAFTNSVSNLIGNVGSATGLLGNNNQSGTAAAPLNPGIAALADNGGSTRTHALLAGSLALDAGTNIDALTTDQRSAGFARLVDLPGVSNVSDGTDIGAFEAQTAPQPELVFANGFE